MARLETLTLKGYRSVRDEVTIHFPTGMPLVFVGENNAGKSNVVRAIDLVLGEWYAGTREPEDHDFWDRNAATGQIEIVAQLADMETPDRRGNQVEGFYWSYDPQASEKCVFRARTFDGEAYVTNEMRDECVCVVVGTDRRLSYQLSYTSKSTLLSKLMRKFHTHLTEDQDRVDQLKQKFGELTEIFSEVAEFAGFQSELSQQFCEMFGGMSHGLQIDFSAYDPSNFFQSLRVLPTEGNTIRTFEELGTGQEQLLALAFAHAYAKAFHGGIILAIEEPEAHLHPLAQKWLARRIRKMATDGLQILVTTHSPAFVDILGLQGLVLVSKIDGATTTKQLTSTDLSDFCIDHGADHDRTSSETVLPFYAGSATQEILAGLFAKKIVLVEGATESLALPIYLRKVGLDVTKEGIAIVPVMGKGNLAKWWRFFTAYGIPTFITFDNDRADDRNATKRKDALKALGVDDSEARRLTATEDWLINDSACVFGTDFEGTMRCSFARYRELEGEARGSTGDSKPLTARFVAQKLALNTLDRGWTRIRELSEKLKALSGRGR